MERKINLNKPLIWKAPGSDRYLCGMVVVSKRVYGVGATMRDAYMDWCMQVYGAAFPKPE